MSELDFKRREQEEDAPRRREVDAREEMHLPPAPATGEAGRTGDRTTPDLRLRYRPAEGAGHTLPGDRVEAVTRQALEGLGGAEERALHLMPEPDVLARLVNDEALEFTPRGDPTPLVPEEESRALSVGGRDEGTVNDELFRRDAELKPEDLEEIARERQELVRTFHAEQGAQMLGPGELTRALGGPPAQQARETQDVARAGAQSTAGHVPEPGRASRGREVLGTPAGERALHLVTQGVSTRFQAWLRREGGWHKRSEWLKKHLARAWEYAPDALNPGTLLFAPRGRAGLAGYLRTEPTPEPVAGKDGKKAPGGPGLGGKAAVGTPDLAEETPQTRTRRGAASGQHERQIREARLRAVETVTRTINKNWAEARDLSWPLHANNDDLGAFLKAPQEGALGRWAAGDREGGAS